METRKITINVPENQAQFLDVLVSLLNSDYSKIIREILGEYLLRWDISKEFANDSQFADLFFSDLSISLKIRIAVESIEKIREKELSSAQRYDIETLLKFMEKRKGLFTNRTFLTVMEHIESILEIDPVVLELVEKDE
ncbi:MAG TPA: hypothetical protein PLS36_05750 [Clostridia bacterium]|nr:hypothetical protein [Clostridia bacterium]